MLIRGAEIDGRAPADVRTDRRSGRIVTVADSIAPRPDEEVVDARGGALLPGIRDHHIHLLALAAAESSVPCGPPEVNDEPGLSRALAMHAASDGWIRGIGYHESVAGDLDRHRLDRLVSNRPVRIQHRSGAMWIVNSKGIEALGLDETTVDIAFHSGNRTGVLHPSGIERDHDGRATGRLYRLDGWLRERMSDNTTMPWDTTLARIGTKLASFGVVGVTDATATNGTDELEVLSRAVARGDLPQRLVIMGSLELSEPPCTTVTVGAVKILLDEHDLPDVAHLEAMVRSAHDRGRSVAIHCVTRATLVLAASVLETAGARRGDRIEHAAVAPPEVVELLADMPVTVVTQPGFIHERGDTYLRDVAPRDRPWLYRGRGFLDAGVPLATSTDAPFGDMDPWKTMRAAVERRSRGGALIGRDETVTPEQALALFTTPLENPGGPAHEVAPGEPADLCLLDCHWTRARRDLSSRHVRAAICAGRVIWMRGNV